MSSGASLNSPSNGAHRWPSASLTPVGRFPQPPGLKTLPKASLISFLPSPRPSSHPGRGAGTLVRIRKYEGAGSQRTSLTPHPQH